VVIGEEKILARQWIADRRSVEEAERLCNRLAVRLEREISPEVLLPEPRLWVRKNLNKQDQKILFLSQQGYAAFLASQEEASPKEEKKTSRPEDRKKQPKAAPSEKSDEPSEKSEEFLDGSFPQGSVSKTGTEEKSPKATRAEKAQSPPKEEPKGSNPPAKSDNTW